MEIRTINNSIYSLKTKILPKASCYPKALNARRKNGIYIAFKLAETTLFFLIQNHLSSPTKPCYWLLGYIPKGRHWRGVCHYKPSIASMAFLGLPAQLPKCRRHRQPSQLAAQCSFWKFAFLHHLQQALVLLASVYAVWDSSSKLALFTRQKGHATSPQGAGADLWEQTC